MDSETPPAAHHASGPEASDLREPSDSILERVDRLATHLARHRSTMLDPQDIGNGDADILVALHDIGAPYCMTPTELSRAVGVTTGAVTKRVDRLDARALVTRRVSRLDHRGRQIALTAEGLALADRVREQRLVVQRELLGHLSQQEAQQLGDLLARLLPDAQDGSATRALP